MKKTLFAALVLMCAPAMADHHIGHAFTHLDEAERLIGKVRNAVNALPICENWSETQVKFATDSLPKRITRAEDRLAESREDLQLAQQTWAMIQGTPGDTSALEALLKQQLFDARSHLSQPNWPTPNPPNSGEFETGYLIVIGKYLIEDHNVGIDSAMCPEAGKRVAEIMLNSTVALRWVNIASWHIFDATNELVHLDQEFICSGPDNHCE